MGSPERLLDEVYFFPLWMQNFEGQLKNLHATLVLDQMDEYGIKTTQDFTEMDFIDFCILVYQERPDLIDISQN